MLDGIELEKRFIEVNGVQLHVVLAGDENGEPILLLHGFPEFWYGWRRQIPYLVEQGYRVVVPDQRGYNLSDKPKDVGAYHIDQLANDAVTLMANLGYETFNLVGHDWGAAVSWWVASKHADKLRKLVILNVPHPSIMAMELTQNLKQLAKSWYMFFFQIPVLPENLIGMNDFKQFAEGMQGNAKKGSFTDADMEAYKRAWGQPNAMKSMINWYRASTRSSSSSSSSSSKKLRISTPTLILWGENDVALTKELAEKSLDICTDGELIFYPNATHWLQHDEADSVNEQIHEFISRVVEIAETVE